MTVGGRCVLFMIRSPVSFILPKVERVRTVIFVLGVARGSSQRTWRFLCPMFRSPAWRACVWGLYVCFFTFLVVSLPWAQLCRHDNTGHCDLIRLHRKTHSMFWALAVYLALFQALPMSEPLFSSLRLRSFLLPLAPRLMKPGSGRIQTYLEWSIIQPAYLIKPGPVISVFDLALGFWVVLMGA